VDANSHVHVESCGFTDKSGNNSKRHISRTVVCKQPSLARRPFALICLLVLKMAGRGAQYTWFSVVTLGTESG
jgi:hypothetical protein